MNEEKYNYKASELNNNDEKVRIKELCNEYGFNLGSSKKIKNNIFEDSLKLKHFPNKENY